MAISVQPITPDFAAEVGDVSLGAGEHAIRWDGMGEDGRRVAPGVYFVNLRAAGVQEARRLLVAP